MMALSTLVYSLQGFIVLRERSNTIIPNVTRRLTRTATLDGKSVISDFGSTVSDGTYIIRVSDITLEDRTLLENLVKDYSLLRLSTKQGCMLGVVKSLNVASTPVEISFLVQEQVS